MSQYPTLLVKSHFVKVVHSTEQKQHAQTHNTNKQRIQQQQQSAKKIIERLQSRRQREVSAAVLHRPFLKKQPIFVRLIMFEFEFWDYVFVVKRYVGRAICFISKIDLSEKNVMHSDRSCFCQICIGKVFTRKWLSEMQIDMRFPKDICQKWVDMLANVAFLPIIETDR